MPSAASAKPTTRHTREHTVSARIATSTLISDGPLLSLSRVMDWFADQVRADESHVEKIPFAELKQWRFAPSTGNLVQDTGKFFQVQGLRVATNHGPVQQWAQPIITQPEIGVLGILVQEFDGILHCLMQAKMEPGNCNLVQLSPTVQATRSNYTGVHRGAAVPYLDLLRHAQPDQVLADVLQSEQGAWFYRKRNRNMVVETTSDIELLPGYCWVSLGQLHHLLSIDNLVNMDTRTVLSCLPFASPALEATLPPNATPRHPALIRSLSTGQPTLCPMDQILRWITEAKAHTELDTSLIRLRDVAGWRREPHRITHNSGRFFDVMAVAVHADHREVAEWTQPMIEAHHTGVVAFLVTQIHGVLHALVHARAEPGYLDVIELGPTVQCTPENHTSDRPPYLDTVLDARPEHVLFDAVLSEEGGRFFHTRNRYMIVETEPNLDTTPNDFQWLALHQLVDLLRHSRYMNVQARSLVACLHSLITPTQRRCDR